MTVNERINFLIDQLEGGNKSAFAEKIGSKSGVIGDLVGGRLNKPSFGLIEKIATSYPLVNTEWLITGEGPAFKKSDTVKETKTAEAKEVFTNGTEKHHELQHIPLYDVTAAAGLNSVYNSSSNILDYIQIPNLPRCDGAIYVKGDSMYPLLKHGDIVAFQRLIDIPEEIMFGEMYVVDMSTPHLDRIMVKYVQESEKGEDYVRLVSYNEKHHKPKDVPIKKIRAMAAVKASIRIN